ncbi:MAG: hypothetical protein J0I54_01555 [Bosea sp.]|uniref:hypothetical protein n=1 Tax=unclassified Bosea (in: a-proteobacteria) TaxID=2653178 RepID=UPI00095FFBAD|nr:MULTISPECIES: hypothetical protein [unclassified Bosea (in: a-proteobacteria)]MBN9455290.1 hypothetical protein [Bosea sp. (in: a-proteobacteria)]OJV04915.1 MAG: hypothetical protein BGO20_17345 [Bosea sp. 67-29]
MADPTGYVRDYSFSGFQASNPQTPLPGQKVDNELANVETSIETLVASVKDLRRSDGALRNGIVTAEALAPGVATGLNPAEQWAPGVQYVPNDTVFFSTAFYRCLVSHVSGADFTVDLANGNWELYAEVGQIVTDAGIARDEALTAAGEAATSAEAAAQSAELAASVVTGDVTQAVRWDVAQALTTPQKLQARQNVGVSSAVDPVLTAATTDLALSELGGGTTGVQVFKRATPALIRGDLALKWSTIYDQTLGANATQFPDVNIAGYRWVRGVLVIVPNTAAADFTVGFRSSTDGPTFPSGASDYIWRYLSSIGSSAGGGGAAASFGSLTQVIESTKTDWLTTVDFNFWPGAASARPQMRSTNSGINSTGNGELNVLTAVRDAVGAAVSLRILANVSNAMAAGSTLVVEGLT